MAGKSIVGACLVVLAGVTLVWRFRSAPRRLNVLVVNACALRPDHLGIYNPASQLTPEVDRWARGAHIFTNAVNERPWETYIDAAENEIGRAFLHEHEYPAFTRRAQARWMIPKMRHDPTGRPYWGEREALDYKSRLEQLKRRLSKNKDQKLYLNVTFKYLMHPYVDRVNLDAKAWGRLDQRITDHVARAEAMLDPASPRLPFLILLSDSFDLFKNAFHLAGRVRSTDLAFTSAERLARWQRTPEYKDDVNALKALYDLKLSGIDAPLAQLLDLFGDPDLKASTVVILTSDHGEAFMEHGFVGHPPDVHENIIRTPLIVKFPPALAPAQEAMINEQVTTATLVSLVHDLIAGSVRPRDFAEAARSRAAEFAFARDCAGRSRAVRWKGQWKLHDGGPQRVLYDLTKDPGETTDVSALHPEVRARLDEELQHHLWRETESEPPPIACAYD